MGGSWDFTTPEYQQTKSSLDFIDGGKRGHILCKSSLGKKG